MELVILGVIYMLPWLCAIVRGSTRAAGVFVLTLLLGWTGLFWVLALVWAFGSDKVVNDV